MENHAGTFSTPELNLSAQGDLVCFSEATPNMFKSQARVLDPITGVTTALPDGDMETNLSACILGHVPSTGEHKLLRVGNVVLRDGWDIIPTNYQRCEVLTLVTGDDDNAGGGQRWRETSSHPSVTVSLADCRHTAVVDGVIYFLLGGLSLNYFPGVKPDSVRPVNRGLESDDHSGSLEHPCPCCQAGSQSSRRLPPVSQFEQLLGDDPS